MSVCQSHDKSECIFLVLSGWLAKMQHWVYYVVDSCCHELLQAGLAVQGLRGQCCTQRRACREVVKPDSYVMHDSRPSIRLSQKPQCSLK